MQLLNSSHTERVSALHIIRIIGRGISRAAQVAIAALCVASIASAAPTDSLPDITPNDNRRAAGTWRDGTLHVDMEVRSGVWFPEGRSNLGLNVAAFAEVGKALQNPGPIIRVPQGARVVVHVRNTLGKTLTIRGLGSTRGLTADSVGIAAGASHQFEFVAATPGTFYYAGATGRAQGFTRGAEDSQLNGAIIVEAPNAPRLKDRVFLISWWYKLDSTSRTGVERVTMAINGQSWPHTEPLNVTQGDSLRWRWINMTVVNHPMHLHGFYFRVDGVGDGARYATYEPEAQRHVVTELMRGGGTMEFTWSPTRPGNWLLHCHVATHMSHLVSIGTVRGEPQQRARVESVVSSHTHASQDRASQSHPSGVTSANVAASHDEHGMAGLVMGIHVAPNGTSSAKPTRYRALRLTIHSKANVFSSNPGFRYSLDSAANTSEDKPDASMFGVSGPTMVLAPYEPVAVTIVNRSHEPGAVHWHGIELDSYPDGVPGFSGYGASVLPAIAPGDSLTVRFTPTRAGTFMYHSHFNEIGQISSGLQGAIVVLAPKTAWNPEFDRVLLFSDDGPTGNQLSGPFPVTRLNGKVLADTLRFRAGSTYRLRLINIRTDYSLTIALSDSTQPLQWRRVAKDGADLPSTQATLESAQLTFGPGEIHDVEFTPMHADALVLKYTMSDLPPPNRQHATVTIIVRN